MDPTTRAATNRAIRNIQTELEFLHDHNLLSESQFSAIEQLLPRANSNPIATPVRSAVSPPPQLAAVTEHFGQASLNEKRDFQQQPQHHSPPPPPPQQFYQPVPSPAPPPPAYNQPPMPPPVPAGPPVLAHATSLYAYHPSDAGDLALQPNDHVEINEYMNADWAKGRNERTGMEGIFPRSYVRIEEKGMMHAQPPPPQRAPEGMGYGNVPMQVATEPVQGGQQPSKVQENGKKFGKKLGNAAIFGAGATIGGNIVNSIF